MDESQKEPVVVGEQPGEGEGAAEFGEPEKNKARKWFERGQSVADSRNYDYAIECYINGLAIWPEAVEEGHKRLLAVGMARRAAGMKKAGVVEAFKHSVNARDPKQAMLNAEFLLAKDPGSSAYMEGVLRNANRARLEQTVRWISPLFLEAVAREKKPSPSRLRTAWEVFEGAGERAQAGGDLAAAIELYQCGVTALEYLQQLRPGDLKVTNSLRDVSGKLTIVKGNYEQAKDFRGSLADGDQQRVLHDEDRLVQSEQRVSELIEKTRQEVAADPSSAAKIGHLVDLLCRREAESPENEAVELLMDAYARLKNYRFKSRADDIRMRQLRRQARALVAESKKDPENGLLRQRAAELANRMRHFELQVYKERVENYPTDLGIRFEYGVRLFQAGRHDEAIPVLQEAQVDPRHRERCRLFIGCCFFAKGYYGQAVEVLNQAIEGHEVRGDALDRELHYWLGRAHEQNGDAAAAAKVYGQIIQWEYNYLDVRQRMDRLRASET